MAVLKGHDVNRLEAADQRSIRPPAAERHLQMHFVRPDMDGRALVPLASRPAVAGPRPKIRELVVAVVRPDDDLAARQPHVRKIAGGVDRRFIAAIETRHIGVEHSRRFLQGITHPARTSASVMPALPSVTLTLVSNEHLEIEGRGGTAGFTFVKSGAQGRQLQFLLFELERHVLAHHALLSTPGLSHIVTSVVSTGARSAERRDLASTISGLSWRQGLSARDGACPERSRGGPRSRRRRGAVDDRPAVASMRQCPCSESAAPSIRPHSRKRRASTAPRFNASSTRAGG